MPLRNGSNIIVQNMNYSPSSSAVEKASGAVNNDSSGLSRVSSDTGTDLSMSGSSNVLGVLKSIEKQQAATRVSSDKNLSKIIDVLDKNGEAPVRNRQGMITSIIDTIKSMRRNAESTGTGTGDSTEVNSNNGDGTVTESNGDMAVRQEVLDEVRKLNDNVAGMGTNITSGFQASLDEAKKKSELEEKVKEIEKKRAAETESWLTKSGARTAGQVASGVGEVVGDVTDKAISGATMALGSAMGEKDKMLIAGLMTAVTTFKSTIGGIKSLGGSIQKFGKWKKGLGKNSQGEEGSTAEEKALAAYNAQLKEVKASHQALIGIGGNLDLSGEQTYHDLMIALTTDVEKDLAEIIKIFNDGPPEGGTTDELVDDMPEVAEGAQAAGIPDLSDALRTPPDAQGESEEAVRNRERLNAATAEGNDQMEREGRMKKMGGKAMSGVVNIFSKLANVFSVLRTAVMGFSVAMTLMGSILFSIPGLIIIGLLALGIALYVFWEDITKAWDDFVNWIKEGWDSLVTSWNTFWDDFLSPIYNAWDSFINWITDTIEYMLWRITPGNLTSDREDFEEDKAKKAKEAVEAEAKAKKEAEEKARKEAEEEAEKNKPKPKDEMYTKEEMKGLSSMSKRPMMEHNRRIRMERSQAKLNAEHEAKLAAEKAKAFEGKLPLVPEPVSEETGPINTNLMDIMTAKDKKDAAAESAGAGSKTNVSVQNNSSTNNVAAGGGGGNKTYVYSGIVPTAPTGGIIVGATD